MNEVQSVALGLAIGLVLISVLSLFPGEPFDYNPKTKIPGKKQKKQEEDDEPGRNAASPAPCSLPNRTPEASKLSECSPATTSDSSPAAPPGALHQQAPPTPATVEKGAEKELQILKIRKLQALLGIEKHKMDELVARADADAIASQEDEEGDEASYSSSFSSSTRSYGAYLDVFFYAVTLGLLAYVLKTEYGIDLLHIVAHMFPREVETATKVLDVPVQFLQQLRMTLQTWVH